MIHDQIEGTCREVNVRTWIGGGASSHWLEVYCATHEWKCGHHHMRWGPILRCMTRHVASNVESIDKAVE